MTLDTKTALDGLRLDIGRRLKEARIRSAIGSQADAARLLTEALGEAIEPSRIGNYEQGLRLPDPITVAALCKLYDTWPSAIYGFAEAPQSSEEAKLLAKVAPFWSGKR